LISIYVAEYFNGIYGMVAPCMYVPVPAPYYQLLLLALVCLCWNFYFYFFPVSVLLA